MAVDEATDILRVRPGEKITVDGTLTDGRSAVGGSMTTGEPMFDLVASTLTAVQRLIWDHYGEYR
jgi:cation transport ATPase